MVDAVMGYTGMLVWGVIALLIIAALSERLWSWRHAWGYYFLMLKTIKRYPEEKRNTGKNYGWRLFKYCLFSSCAWHMMNMGPKDSVHNDHYYFSTTESYVKPSIG